MRTISKFSHFVFTFNFDQLASRYNQTLNSLKVIAHSNFNAEFDTVITNNKIGYSRAAGQFGNLLPEELQINSGVGPKFSINKDPTVSVLRPTQVFDENLKITIGNVSFEFFHAPGETEDHINLVLRQEKIVIPGDNIYPGFPNLYAIRGSRTRDATIWAESVRKVHKVSQEIGNGTVLVGLHGPPVQHEFLQRFSGYFPGKKFPFTREIYFYLLG